MPDIEADMKRASELLSSNRLPKVEIRDGMAHWVEPSPEDADTQMGTAPTSDHVNHPVHYTSHPSGIECIQITEHMGFCLGNAVKYIWRAGLKSEDPIKDLEKAAWYIAREVDRLRKG